MSGLVDKLPIEEKKGLLIAFQFPKKFINIVNTFSCDIRSITPVVSIPRDYFHSTISVRIFKLISQR